MDNHIVCPNCRKQIPLTEAFTHELREKYKKALLDERANLQRKLEEEKKRLTQEISEREKKKIEEQMALKLKDSKNESEELKQQNKNLQEQLLELNKLMRQLRSENETKRLEMEKKLADEQEKIRTEEKKRIEDEFRLREKEKDKKLEDALKVNEELRRKLEQGSQQTQGEVLELELENMLRVEFPLDEIKPVPKGITGGDIIHVVKNNTGKACGTIIWETKRTKSWSNEWLSKLKNDQRSMKAEFAVVISEVLPVDVKNFGFRDGVWIANFGCILGIAMALRKNLLDVALIRSSQVGKNEKMEILYNYLYGTEFQNRVEAILESFTSLQNDLEKEKRWMMQKWAKQESNIRRVIDNTVGLRGDVQSITGKSLPNVEGVDLLPDGADSSHDEQETLL